ncbi:S-methyl-5-thioribose-1-phosphate isomerase [Swingsia samuiensis]|uniref:Methylthioribose-1-phosphate isomerase n=1 Tax=Swingsia samuiensis TaxID=1293412 RepID=A0A4Y6UGB8_9PROT|nr:S-methyl-5-thioribose-1-phosphate isomerase [Swingsia samuiensis]QDH16593.1 S-methyl-5-thioribose-1-phosphate isomerase [Swingsia samuiensis]
MKINGTPYRSVWRPTEDPQSIRIFDQTRFPWEIDILELRDVHAVMHVIRSMQVRGAPLIGAVAAYGLVFALQNDPSNSALHKAAEELISTRPTAINLRWAIERLVTHLQNIPPEERVSAGYQEADAICDEDVKVNEAIGEYGLELIREIWERKGKQGRVNLLTHCNAGWIATVDWGTALAPIYMAHDAGIPVHVWVDETRPRDQGSLLTAWELGSHGVPHTVIVDNAGGHFMQTGDVDMVIVGTDRVTAQGDVANKIGTYLKALAAKDNNIPFWVALPSSTIDWRVKDGVKDIPIEERSSNEVLFMHGITDSGDISRVRIAPEHSPAANPAFDVTPARLVTGLITERGRCDASEAGLKSLFPEE